ncbi:uncharacterized protein LOC126842794 [Adelges cooleyi]|uniref:uncharacterized protein LOC126842794 n=1 Tax=Adelges cooleyi TaxID=133065 RepID=UPI0021806E7F|nr:uncharacterized protein LOC126842794 [Adelges cooleyi]XP_050435907.1 uncharacterized protein LOC126842794 [Adelges cooleyi]XP_050435908.1 uncharacterized protein LOC126842794 [Adelges cooleyi]XP_050435909.1 uncharacterized protein LOC126842794 [Adelges cooleyi]XP_050435911.1 uncharacterized protein LOC126842794 [Adelges cooleyi]XP_050435912.1 uncharacterized protein LOC126842794 [Adelges cooleyi]XP_050435913.1 uncharacterized protein LOC126842794 [Adelges cooleyi]
MGQTVSQTRSNDELINMLVNRRFIRTIDVEKVLRSVDRGFYYTVEHKRNAYRDSAWQSGKIHLSAPCIYAKAMECLALKPGNRFLNIGSGIGYFSTVAGLLLGPNGVNHGIEIHESLIEHAYTKLEEFKLNAAAIDYHDFCEPIFIQGNACELLPMGYYDRVYCGAGVPPEETEFMKSLINIGGILVMPLEGFLLKITRKDEHSWQSVKVLEVSFTDLVIPEKTSFKTIEFPVVEPPSLQDLCRSNIRSSLRETVEDKCAYIPMRTKCTEKNDTDDNEHMLPHFNNENFGDPLTQFVRLRFGGSEEGLASFRNIVDTLVGLEDMSETPSISEDDDDDDENDDDDDVDDDNDDDEEDFPVEDSVGYEELAEAICEAEEEVEESNIIESPERQSDDSTKRKSPEAEVSDASKVQAEVENPKRIKLNSSTSTNSNEPSTSSHNTSDMWETVSTESSHRSLHNEDSGASWFSSVANDDGEEEDNFSFINNDRYSDDSDSDSDSESKVDTILYSFKSDCKENPWSKMLKDKINDLPIPVPLKHFLNYHRVD